eukprot:Tbor_TRINITY_DN4756_c0_g1::TRINITY_DN4756_c0_g1_i3::g.16923::m.16923
MSDINLIHKERTDRQRELLKNLEDRVVALEAKKDRMKFLAAQRRKKDAVKAKSEVQQKTKEAAMSAFNEEYRDRMMKVTQSDSDVNRAAAKPFIGFGLVEEEEYNGTTVIVVDNVWQGGPADQVGLQPGDIITHVGEYEINTIDEFRKYYNEECKCGEFTMFKVTRPGQSWEKEIPTWIMTTDEKYHDQPFYFDMSKSVKKLKDSSHTS